MEDFKKSGETTYGDRTAGRNSSYDASTAVRKMWGN